MFLNGTFEIPERNSVDALAEAREARDERTRARMSRKAYKDDILQRLSEMLDDDQSPLGEMAERFFEVPVQNRFDYEAARGTWTGELIGKSIMSAILYASLDAYQDADVEGF